MAEYRWRRLHITLNHPPGAGLCSMLAGLKHHFVDRDAVLTRMLPQLLETLR